ncbi:MAG: elongation factor P hydroxylase [Halieaceae bacterium]
MTAQQRITMASAARFDSQRLERVFSHCFAESQSTLLQGGAKEPFYAPAEGAECYHELHYREDYFASALHEVSHWCIAGSARRLRADFGYWYAPEGRNAEQQLAFESVESRPQALEWLFSKACGFPFQVSLDNFSEDASTYRLRFVAEVYAQALNWQSGGLPSRAQQFFAALSEEFGTALSVASVSLSQTELG